MTNSVIEYQTNYARKVRGTDIAKGQTVYAIQDNHTGLYFIWAYSNKEYAEKIASRVVPEDAQDRACNWRARMDQCVVTNRDKD